ncbi:MAG: RNA methyltransferase, partial [Betaproteobacteria bacterium HGW-Betaproteobacteria-21]
DLSGPVAWLFGAEGQGVSAALLARADEIVTIPMAAGSESLNVGAAAAVCLFEQVRQAHARQALRFAKTTP